ncbi:hypothetical protein HYU19_04030 [Candidatus Woesearchaeota archaeon]|nr:hypothetical protein [Candidatus Woesearchaeota archaeon]
MEKNEQEMEKETRIILRCGCSVHAGGSFHVGQRCQNCRECTAIAELHPFGMKRLG